MKRLIFGISFLTILNSCSNNAPSLDHWKTSNDYDSLGRIELEEDRSRWAEVHDIEDKLVVELVYASVDNPEGRPLYECERCFLTRETADAFRNFVDTLNQQGFIVKLLDCYRPRRVQWIIDQQADGSSEKINFFDAMHNRGMAVDITLLDRNGQPVDMGSAPYLEGPEAYHDNFDITPEAQKHRRLLMNLGRSLGFQAVRHRWWQYNYRYTTALSNDFVWYCDR